MKVEIMKYPTIVLIGHMGLGGIYGLPARGKAQTKEQIWLDNIWENSKKRIGIPKEYPHVVVFGGELTEGYNPKGGIEDIYLPRLEDQRHSAVERMLEWIGEETEEILILFSHSYHGSYERETRVENDIAMELEKELLIKGFKTKVFVGTKFERSYYGKNIRFAHGASGAVVYLSSANERSIKFNLEQSALGKANNIDMHFEFHGHRLSGARFGVKQGTWCPCFKLLDTSGQTQKPDAWLPDIGFTILTFQNRWEEVQVNADHILYIPSFDFEALEQSKHEWNKKIKQETKKQRIIIDTQMKGLSSKSVNVLGILKKRDVLKQDRNKNKIRKFIDKSPTISQNTLLILTKQKLEKENRKKKVISRMKYKSHISNYMNNQNGGEKKNGV